MNEMIGITEIKKSICNWGLSNALVSFHCSLKSFGGIDGGADALIDAFVDSGTTIVVPTHSYNCERVFPSGVPLYLRNGLDYSRQYESMSKDLYFTESTFVSKSMGVLPRCVLGRREHIRGNHPIDSLSAIGPLAQELISTQAPLDVYAPFEKMYSMERAFLVLAGVGLTRATAIHFAEKRAGRRMFRRWAEYRDEGIMEVEIGSCSSGFENMGPSVANIRQETIVGQSQWMIFPFQKFIDCCASAMRKNPTLTMCNEPDCIQCKDMVAGGPVI